MALARHTSGWRGQKLNAHCVLTLHSKLLTPDKEEDGYTRGYLFCFSLSPFYYNCNPNPPLRKYKREGRGHI